MKVEIQVFFSADSAIDALPEDWRLKGFLPLAKAHSTMNFDYSKRAVRVDDRTAHRLRICKISRFTLKLIANPSANNYFRFISDDKKYSIYP